MASKIMFDRKWKIVLEVKEEVDGDMVNVEGKTRELQDLKVTFAITNTMLGDPSLASFQIYNVSDKTTDLLTTHGCYISFYAGYHSDREEDWNVLFSGEITNSYEIRQQTDLVWNVWARNKYSLLEISEPNIESYAEATPVKTILEALTTDAVGLAGNPTYVGDSLQVIEGAEDLLSYVAVGTYAEEFDDVLGGLGLGWTVQGDELLVFDTQLTDPTESETDFIDVSNKTGLLSIPVVSYTGVTFSHLLSGQFKPSKIIDVNANTTRYDLGNEFYVEHYDQKEWRSSGLFRIYEVKHKGDTRGSRWTTDVTAFYRRN